MHAAPLQLGALCCCGRGGFQLLQQAITEPQLCCNTDLRSRSARSGLIGYSSAAGPAMPDTYRHTILLLHAGPIHALPVCTADGGRAISSPQA